MKNQTKSLTESLPGLSREPRDGFYLTPASSLDERVHRIEALGKRIDTYIHYMCQIAAMNGTSVEAKDRGVAAFYERLVIVESQLRRIHDALQLE